LASKSELKRSVARVAAAKAKLRRRGTPSKLDREVEVLKAA
jgi:hypothetical protein